MKQFKRDENQNSNKLNLDKYYTSDELAQYCIDKTMAILKDEDISEIIEPSAGNGVFSKKIDDCIAYDLEPEDDTVTKQDFLQLEIPYKTGRLFIGNPPYGSRCNLAKAFCNKAFELGDFVSFILPISQLNNTQSIYKFDLVYSEDLGIKQYSDRNVHCCLNIYKRPNGDFNKRNNYKILEILEILEIRESIKNKNPKRNRIVSGFDYDIAICAWGNIGKELEYEGQYVKEFYIKIHKTELKDKILGLIRNAKWNELYPMTAVPNLLQWQVYKYVLENIR
jgi:predicted RNA methylase